MSRVAAWVAVGAGVVAFAACTLDFGRFEGEVSGGGGSGASVGGSGGSGNTGGSVGGTGGSVGGTGGAGGDLPVGCSNGVKDGTESDIDCGGDCSGCSSQFCDASTCGACADDVDCAAAPDSWCDGGSCVDKKILGAACLVGCECLSSACTDSVCCGGTCGGVCEACTAALTGGVDGTCAPVIGTTDPDGNCPGQVCDGAGACAICVDSRPRLRAAPARRSAPAAATRAPAPSLATTPTSAWATHRSTVLWASPAWCRARVRTAAGTTPSTARTITPAPSPAPVAGRAGTPSSTARLRGSAT